MQLDKHGAARNHVRPHTVPKSYETNEKYETNDYEPAIFGSIAHVRKMSTKKRWKNEKKR